jgi:hypothetical protein
MELAPHLRALSLLRDAQSENAKTLASAVSILKAICRRLESITENIANIDSSLPTAASNLPPPEPALASLLHDVLSNFANIPDLASAIQLDLLERVELIQTAYATLKPVNLPLDGFKRLEIARNKRDSAQANYGKACRQIEELYKKVQAGRKSRGDLTAAIIDHREVQESAIAAFEELNRERQLIWLACERLLHESEKIETDMNAEIGKKMVDMARKLDALALNYLELDDRIRSGVARVSSREDVEASAGLEDRSDSVVCVEFTPPPLNFDLTAVENVDPRVLFAEEIEKYSARVKAGGRLVTVENEKDGEVAVLREDGTTEKMGRDAVDIIFRRKLAKVSEPVGPVIAGETVLVVGIEGDEATCENVLGVGFVISVAKLTDL